MSSVRDLLRSSGSLPRIPSPTGRRAPSPQSLSPVRIARSFEERFHPIGCGEGADEVAAGAGAAAQRALTPVQVASPRIEVIEIHREGNRVTFGVLKDGCPLKMTKSVELPQEELPGSEKYNAAYRNYVQEVRAVIDETRVINSQFKVTNHQMDLGEGGEVLVKFDLEMKGMDPVSYSLPFDEFYGEGDEIEVLAAKQRGDALTVKNRVEVREISEAREINGGAQLEYTVLIDGYRPRRILTPSMRSQEFLMGSLASHVKYLSHFEPEVSAVKKTKRGMRGSREVFEVSVKIGDKSVKKEFSGKLGEEALQKEINAWLLSQSPEIEMPIIYPDFEQVTLPDDGERENRGYTFLVEGDEIRITIEHNASYASGLKEAQIRLQGILQQRALKRSPLSAKALSQAGQSGPVVTLQTFSPDPKFMHQSLHHGVVSALHATVDDHIGGVDAIRDPLTHFSQHGGGEGAQGAHGAHEASAAGVSPEVALIPLVGGLALMYLGSQAVQESRHEEHAIHEERERIALLEREAATLRGSGQVARAEVLERDILFRQQLLSEHVRAARIGYCAGGSVVVSGGATSLYGASMLPLGLGLGSVGVVAQQIAPPFACLAYFLSAILFAGKTRDAQRQLGLIAKIEAKGQVLLHNGDLSDDPIGEILIKFAAHERERLNEERVSHGLTTAVTTTGGASALMGTLAVLGAAGFIAVNAAALGTLIIATAIGAGGLAGVKYVRSKRVKPGLQEAKELREHENTFLHEERILQGLGEYILGHAEVLALFAEYVGMEPEDLRSKLVETQRVFKAERDLVAEGSFDL